MKLRTWILGALLASLFCAGCVREVRSPKLMVGQRAGKVDLTPVDSAALSLFLSNERMLRAGGPGEITFVLRNTGKKPVRIPEWFAYEPDNLLVYCQPWLPDMKDPDPEGWIPLSFDLRVPVTHTGLELQPGEQVSVAKQLPFVAKLSVSSNAERRYFVRAELNLKTLKLVSAPAAVAVRGGR